MFHWISSLCATLALVGVSFTGATAVAAQVHRRGRAPDHPEPCHASILKPLCGLDDGLAENLASLADLDRAEVLLGVRSPADPAWPVALAAAARWPGRFRVVVQRGEPGLNPKVNQLVTLAEEASHDLLVISDSNCRHTPGWLAEIAALLARPEVGLVTSPPVGEGGETLGAHLDALHLGGTIGPGMVALGAIGQPLVVGKTMALRRETLGSLGGMAAFANVLAEDWVMGQRVHRELGLRVAVARAPVRNVCRRRSVRMFMDRYRRWSVMQRCAVGTPTYLAQSLLQPTAFALGAAALDLSLTTLAVLILVAMLRVGQDALALAAWGADRRLALLAPLRDLLLAAAWGHGLLHDEVDWRGNRLRVGPGTRLEPSPDPTPLATPDLVR